MSKTDPDIADLVGDGPRPRRGRPPTRHLKEAADRLIELTAARRIDRAVTGDAQLQDFSAGLSTSTLARIFSLHPMTVKQRLADCPAMHRRKNGFLYDIAVAAPYLVKPVFDVQKYMASMKPSEMPANLQAAYWDAMLKKQRWEENAGDLYRADAVQDVLSDTFQLIKQTVQLWTDTMSESVTISEPQRLALIALGDALLDDIANALKMRAKEKQTYPTLAEIPETPYVEEQEIDASHLV